ncbi:MAG: hypothetical protein WBG42_06735, partial [Cryomorphaceae bacterium]
KLVYSKLGLSYEWQFKGSSSDFQFTNLADPQKSFDLWLNYSYFGMRVESGVSIPFPLDDHNGLMFDGLTFNLGAGINFATVVGNEFVSYKSEGDLSSEDLKIQDDLRGLITPPEWNFNPYVVGRIGYNSFFVEFIFDFVAKDAVAVVEENIYNLKENENRRSNFLIGIGYRFSVQEHSSIKKKGGTTKKKGKTNKKKIRL